MLVSYPLPTWPFHNPHPFFVKLPQLPLYTLHIHTNAIYVYRSAPHQGRSQDYVKGQGRIQGAWGASAPLQKSFICVTIAINIMKIVFNDV